MTITLRRLLCTVLMIATTIACFASGKIEVNPDIVGGTVTGSMNGLVATIVVKPDAEHYFRRDGLVAEKTFMPVMAANSRCRVPVAGELTVVGDDPDDLSLERTYTITMPSAEYDLYIDAEFLSRTVITESMVTLSDTKFVYSGSVQRPMVSVAGLTEGRDYTVTYSPPQSIEAGDYTVTVSGCSTYSGTVTQTYIIYRGGNVVVNPYIEDGEVVTSVDGLTVTITVTPASGYYIRRDDITISKTFMPHAPARVPIADTLPLEGDDPDDLTHTRVYTVQLPGYEYDVYVDAYFTPRTVITSDMLQLDPQSFIFDGQQHASRAVIEGLQEDVDFTVSYETASTVSVGSYNVTVNGRSTYQGAVTKAYTIAKADPQVEAPVAQTLTYDRMAHPLLSAGTAEGGTMLYSTDGTAYTTDVPTATDAGSYVVYYKVEGDSNHNDVAAQSITVVIGCKTVASPLLTLSQQAYTYDATEHKPAVQVKDGDDVIPASEYGVTYTDNVNAGVARVSIADSGSGNYAISDASATFTINKAEPVVVAPVAQNLTYNRTAQQLVGGSATGGTMLYSTDGSTFATDVPTATDAGSYVVYYKVEGDSNHHSIAAESVEVTISRKPVAAPQVLLSQYTYTFDTTEHTPDVEVRDGDDVIPASEYTVAYADNVYPGDASVTISDSETGNYVIATAAVAFTIDEAEPVTVSISAIGWATLYTTLPLDFSGVSGLTAYTATLDGTKVTLTEVDDVPANTGVVLKADADVYRIPVVLSSTTEQGDLTGSTTATAWDAEEGYTYYMLASVDGGAAVQFVSVRKGSIAAGKAFLRVAKSLDIKALGVDIDDATGVSAMSGQQNVGTDIYNLSGHRVTRPTKGLYIVNGKKVLIR